MVTTPRFVPLDFLRCFLLLSILMVSETAMMKSTESESLANFKSIVSAYLVTRLMYLHSFSSSAISG